ERAEVLRLEREETAQDFAGHDRWRVEGYEVTLFFVRVADLHADVRPGDQGAQPGHGRAGDSRGLDPEIRILDQEGLGSRGHLRRRDCLPVVVGESDLRESADVHAVVVDLRLAGDEAL